MAKYIALLRAVNVGGTGKLPMAELKQMAQDLGYKNPQTYIASGNLVFESNDEKSKIKISLEQKLYEFFQKPCGVIVRTDTEMAEVIANNPFKQQAPNRVIITFLDEEVSNGFESQFKNQKYEEFFGFGREIYLHYGDGMAQSKLSHPLFKIGTGRNLNTCNKLLEFASKT